MQNNSVPYIDFHRSTGEDFNTRIINDLSGQLTTRSNVFRVLNSSNGNPGRIDAGTIVASSSLSVNGINVADRLPNFVHKATYFGSDGNVVPKPSCGSGGTPKIIVTPTFFQLKNDASNTQEGLNAWAVDNGGSWIVRIRSYFTGNGEFTGAGLAQTYCHYS